MPGNIYMPGKIVILGRGEVLKENIKDPTLFFSPVGISLLLSIS
jgi:hypothetical protein